MLEHQKKVLQGVADNADLFKKELVKSMIWLNAEELTSLREWLKDTYWEVHKNIIHEVLYIEAA